MGNFRKTSQIYLHSFLWGLAIAPIIIGGQAVAQFNFNPVGSGRTACQPPILSRLDRHSVVAGETIESIAQRYNLLPETLIRLNPSLTQGSVTPGTEILIPPFNGIRVQVPTGATWQDLANAYGIRPDVLFELNGCSKTPDVVFIPGVNWTSENRQNSNTYTGFTGYPLPNVAPIGLAYGWQTHPSTQQQMFHSGIDLQADPETPVLAVEAGTVVFVGQQGNYGNLVVVNHAGGGQTRYGQLSRANVQMGQQVNTGDRLGTVGNSGRPDIDSPHLHFEVRYQTPSGWIAQDPEIHLKPQTSFK
ncbi:MAG: LysM peptidoglycan-binding domain-containing M23 family metallopeptidase [Chroococcales cyanobacterium]